MGRLVLLGLALALAGCAAGRVATGGVGDPLPGERFVAHGREFRLEYGPDDAEAAADVREMLEEAVPRARRWGDLHVPVTITIHPTHEALEAAIRHRDVPWLRAWARYASIDLQAPRSWSSHGGDRDKVLEVVVHELAHCVMYQSAGTSRSWAHKEIPLWFREGLASVTAEEGYRREGPESLFRFYVEPRASGAPTSIGSDGAGAGDPARRARVGDPISDPDPLYQSEPNLVYGTAHLAFEFLVRRYGEARVREVLANMRDGATFGPAFRAAIGIEAAAFERELRRYVLWQAWRKD